MKIKGLFSNKFTEMNSQNSVCRNTNMGLPHKSCMAYGKLIPLACFLHLSNGDANGSHLILLLQGMEQWVYLVENRYTVTLSSY
jgi:hypothetical protein